MTDHRQERVLDAIRQVRAVPVLRSRSTAEAVATGTALAAGGLTALEVTYSVPNAAAAIGALAELPGICVGAGTVTTEAQAAEAAHAGAQFIVSPVSPPWFLDVATELGILAIPGAASPTEIWQAHDRGALAVKVFPIARLGGAAYVRDLLGPLPALQLMATGGVTPAIAVELLAAGCVAVGLGSVHTDEGLGATVEERAQAMVRQLQS